MKASALALAFLLIAPGCSAQADVPVRSEESEPVAAKLPDRPDGPVLDEADLLPADTEVVLDKRLRDSLERNRAALIVVSVNSLGGEPIERFSLRLAREWEIGDWETRRGLLVLVAPNERRVRIEVSCGLESVITDEFAGQVIREHMTPRFQEGHLDQGTLAAVDALIERLDANADAEPDLDSCPSQTRKAA